MSLTAEPGARPWQSPPQFNTVEEVSEFYIERISDPELSPQILDVIELGYPLVTLANSFTLGGVMMGKHTIDVAILVTPIITEWLRGMAEDAEIEYKLGIEPEMTAGNKNPDGILLSRAMKEVFDKKEEEDEEDIVEEDTPEEEVESLMRRRS